MSPLNSTERNSTAQPCAVTAARPNSLSALSATVRYWHARQLYLMATSPISMSPLNSTERHRTPIPFVLSKPIKIHVRSVGHSNRPHFPFAILRRTIIVHMSHCIGNSLLHVTPCTPTSSSWPLRSDTRAAASPTGTANAES